MSPSSLLSLPSLPRLPPLPVLPSLTHPSRPRVLQLVIGSLLLLTAFWTFGPASDTITLANAKLPDYVFGRLLRPLGPPLHRLPAHPIDDLLARASADFDAALRKQTHTIRDAAEAYRSRRGRQPPPLFDEWFTYAKINNAAIVEDFFDQIYHDLGPFWAIAPSLLRRQARSFQSRLTVRNGSVTHRERDDHPWMRLWSDAVAAISEYLPDLDMPINLMDESRMVVPWEEINEYMHRQDASRKVVDAARLKTTFSTAVQSLASPDHDPVDFTTKFDSHGPYWSKYVVGCSPDSLARNTTPTTDFDNAPDMDDKYPHGSYHGYVRNWTMAKSPCFQPHLRSLHGTFIEPITIKHTSELFPLFGGSKLPMNNEILLPPAMYLSDMAMYSGGDRAGGPWSDKRDGLIWRGVASGGRNRAENWRHFQRHRLVAMLNSTAVEAAEAGDRPQNFVLPSPDSYDLSTPLAAWLRNRSDAAFTELLCFPGAGRGVRTCNYTSPYFSNTTSVPMAEQYDYKYLPDVDGNSFSGRYRAFLLSTSLPVKSTIYAEWHDSRLWPWKHFVPMDNTFVDIYGILQYFMGDERAGAVGHDAVAEKIAADGRAWAEEVLRREDMHIYIYRLLLEYARICDDDRETMGWAG